MAACSLRVLRARRNPGDRNTAEEEDTAASALLLNEFLDGGADDVTLATLGEVLLEHAHHIRGTASNLAMYVSAANNDYVVTGTFLGTALQGVWSTARLDFLVQAPKIVVCSIWGLMMLPQHGA